MVGVFSKVGRPVQHLDSGASIGIPILFDTLIQQETILVWSEMGWPMKRTSQFLNGKKQSVSCPVQPTQWVFQAHKPRTSQPRPGTSCKVWECGLSNRHLSPKVLDGHGMACRAHKTRNGFLALVSKPMEISWNGGTPSFFGGFHAFPL